MPGSFLCDQYQPGCTGGVNPHADAAEAFAIDTLEFFRDHHGRNSIDNNGMTFLSTVQFKTNYDNAFWNGIQAVYGDAFGFPLADDVVAGEFTHGVTEYSSNLLYYYQSGSINDSFSDLWGEFIDQTNGAGTDTPAVKWLLGEDVQGLGAIRDMKNPPHFSDPDRMLSSYYYKGDLDNGGVHTNSGVNNKVVYLLTDGGTFNAKTISPLGLNKVAAIYYEVQTNLLTSGSDYLDLYNALYQACVNLVGGAEGITLAECQQVRNASDAVQMNKSPTTAYNPEAEICPTGMTTAPSLTLFEDNLESGTGNWLQGNLNGTGRWLYSSGYATSGNHMLWADDSITYSDSYTRLATGISLPSGSSPFLRFKHAYDFDRYNTTYYDGGVLEYSINGGTTWLDAKPLWNAGANYTGSLQSRWGNPIGGRNAFVGASHGYVSSRYNLSSLAGKNVLFRWRLGTDESYNFLGWFLDDVQVYTCVGTPSIPSLLSPASNALTTDYTPTLDWSDPTPKADHYQLQVATDSLFNTLTIDKIDITSSVYEIPTDLNSNTPYYWRVKAFNAIGGTNGWSAVRTLRTALLPPTLTAPVDEDELLNNRPTFTWDPIPFATGYTIQISKNELFTSLVGTYQVTTASYTPTSDLPINSHLFWRVQSKGTNGPSAWSLPTRSIHTTNSPSIPTLVSPATNTLTTNYKPTLDWAIVTVPVGDVFNYYRIQVSDNPGFISPVIDDTSKTSISGHTFAPASDLNPNTTYYWRVSAYNTDLDYSSWSAVRTFRTALLPPTLTAPVDEAICTIIAQPSPGIPSPSPPGTQSRSQRMSSSPPSSAPTRSPRLPTLPLQTCPSIPTFSGAFRAKAPTVLPPGPCRLAPSIPPTHPPSPPWSPRPQTPSPPTINPPSTGLSSPCLWEMCSITTASRFLITPGSFPL